MTQLEPSNPYHAPVAKIAESAPHERLKIEPASKWRRFFNLIIDWVCYQIVVVVMVIPYAVYLYQQGGDAALAQLEEGNLLRDFLLGTVALLLYYIAMEGFFGFTIGKLVTGTRVVNEDGGRPTWGQIVGRSFARLIPFEPFSVLFSVDDESRGWHDSLPKTWVVRKR